MKFKTHNTRSISCWSPSGPNYSRGLLAAGTLGGTIDIDFDTSATLEIFDVLSPTSQSFVSLGTAKCAGRFHTIVWGDVPTKELGLIAGGTDNGVINIYDPKQLITNENGEELCSLNKHSGDVHALDFNVFAKNLLLSGGNDGEVLIWDLTDLSKVGLHSPGTKPGTLSAEVSSVKWNNKVQHVFASTHVNGHAVIWDLRQKKALVSLNDKTTKKLKDCAWDMNETTQLVVVAEDENAQNVQLWDLRKALSPLAVLEGHRSGVWSVDWCPHDYSLFATAARDRTLVWNRKTLQVVCEVQSEDWDFRVEWAKSSPAVLSTCTNDGTVNIHSLHDFPQQLSTPPRWIGRTKGITFGFGGNIVSFSDSQTVDNSTVTTSEKIIESANFLDKVFKEKEKVSDEMIKEFAEKEKDKQFWDLLLALNSSENKNESAVSSLSKLFEFSNEKDVVAEDNEEKMELDESQSDNSIEIPCGSEGDLGALARALVQGHTERACSILLNQHRAGLAFLLARKRNLAFAEKLEKSFMCRFAQGKEEPHSHPQKETKSFPDSFPESENENEHTHVEFTLSFRRFFKLYLEDNYSAIVELVNPTQWREALLLVSALPTKEFHSLATKLGQRMVNADPNASAVCFTAARNINALVELWQNSSNAAQNENTNANGDSVMSLIRAGVARSALNITSVPGKPLTQCATKYAQTLCAIAQPALAKECLNAFGLFDAKVDDNLFETKVLLDRVAHLLKENQNNSFPFPTVEIGSKAIQQKSSFVPKTQTRNIGKNINFPTSGPITNQSIISNPPSQPISASTFPLSFGPTIPTIPLMNMQPSSGPTIPTIPLIQRPTENVVQPFVEQTQQIPLIPQPMQPQPSISMQPPVQHTQPLQPQTSTQPQPFQPLVSQPSIPMQPPGQHTQPLQPPSIPLIPQPTQPALSQPNQPFQMQQPPMQTAPKDPSLSRAPPITLEKTVIEEKASTEVSSVLERLNSDVIPSLLLRLKGTSESALVEDAARRLSDISTITLNKEVASILVNFTNALCGLSSMTPVLEEELEHYTTELAKHGHELTMARVIGLKKLKLAALKAFPK